MLGDTQAAHGATVGFLVGAPFELSLGIACGLVGYMFSWGADLDHLQSKGSRWIRIISLGIFAAGFAGLVYSGVDVGAALILAVGALALTAGIPLVLRAWSARLGLPKHRGLTHTFFAAEAVGITVGLIAVWVTPVWWQGLVLGVAAGGGYWAGMQGDRITNRSLLYYHWRPGMRRQEAYSPGPPEWMRFDTGEWFEKEIVYPLSLLVCVGALVLGVVV